MRASSSLPYTGLLPRPPLSCLKKILAFAIADSGCVQFLRQPCGHLPSRPNRLDCNLDAYGTLLRLCFTYSLHTPWPARADYQRSFVCLRKSLFSARRFLLCGLRLSRLDSSRILCASWVVGRHRNDTRFSSVLQFRHADHAGIRRHRSGHAARADIGGAGGCNWSALHRHHRGASGRCLPAGRWRRELILEGGGPLTKLHLLTILYLGPKERAPMRAAPRTSSAGLILY